MHTYTYILADKVGNYAVIIALSGEISIIESARKSCRGHLREAGRKGREKIIKKCLDAIESNYEALKVEFVAINYGKVCGKRGSAIQTSNLHNILSVLANSIRKGYATYVYSMVEHNETCLINIVESLLRQLRDLGIRNAQLKTIESKDDMGIVEVLARVKLSTFESDWKKYRPLKKRLEPMIGFQQVIS